MAIISSVTFLLRLCLCLTEPHRKWSWKEASPRGGGGPSVRPFPACSWGTLSGPTWLCVELRQRAALCTGERVGGPEALTLAFLCALRIFCLLSPVTASGAPDLPERRARGGRADGRNGGTRWALVFTQLGPCTNGRDTFQTYGESAYFFPQALELCH